MELEPRACTARGPDRSYKLTTHQANTSVLLTQTEVYMNFPIRPCPILTHSIVILVLLQIKFYTLDFLDPGTHQPPTLLQATPN